MWQAQAAMFFTALMSAAVDGLEAVAKQVLDHGADVASAKHNGETALIFAAAEGGWTLVQIWQPQATTLSLHSDSLEDFLDAKAQGGGRRGECVDQRGLQEV